MSETKHDAHASATSHGGPGKGIGITMAALGVMLALCAALVGSQRTSLIRTMVEQSNKLGVVRTEAMKYRVMQADHAILHALTPSKAELAKFETALTAVRSRTGKADDEDTSELKDTVDVSTRGLADVVSPDTEDEDRFARLRDRYQRDLAEAKEDAEAYDPAIEAHHEAAERYERAQLCAEIGIVIASIALLLGNRTLWGLAIAIGIAGAGIIGTTYVHTGHALDAATQKIADAAKNTAQIDEEDEGGAHGATRDSRSR